jgi:nicotinamidase-related amidase
MVTEVGLGEKTPEIKRVVVPEYRIEEKVVLDPKTTALVIVDMQNDFVDPKGKLFVPSAPDTIPAIKRLIDKARKSKVPVVYTQDWHMKDDPEFKIWGEHAVAGTWGAEIVDEIKPREDDIVVKKLRYDAFYGTSLDHILRTMGVDTLVITGTVANICVLHTAGS